MLNKDLKKEVIRMCIGVPILSVVMIIIYAVCGKFDLPVLFGAIIGTAVTLLNFFLLALSVEHVSKKEDEAAAKLSMNVSYFARIILIAIVVVIAIKMPQINYITAILPLLFERIVIMTHTIGKGGIK